MQDQSEDRPHPTNDDAAADTDERLDLRRERERAAFLQGAEEDS